MANFYRLKSQQAIERAVSRVHKDADIITVKDAIDRAYPFLTLEGWAFKMWQCERMIYLRKRFPGYGKRSPAREPAPLFDPPHERPMEQPGRPRAHRN